MGELRQPLLKVKGESDDLAGETSGCEQQRRDHEGCGESEHGINDHKYDRHHNEHDKVRKGDRGHCEDQPELAQIRRCPGHEFSSGCDVMERERQALDVRENAIAEIRLGPVGHLEAEIAAERYANSLYGSSKNNQPEQWPYL